MATTDWIPQALTAGVSGDTNVAIVEVGDFHSCALTTAGKLHCWGSDFNGQLGNGATTGDQAGPVQAMVHRPPPGTRAMRPALSRLRFTGRLRGRGR